MIIKSVQKEGGGEGGRLGSQEVNQKESENKTKPEANCITVDQNALRCQHILLYRKAREGSAGQVGHAPSQGKSTRQMNQNTVRLI